MNFDFPESTKIIHNRAVGNFNWAFSGIDFITPIPSTKCDSADYFFALPQIDGEMSVTASHLACRFVKLNISATKNGPWIGRTKRGKQIHLLENFEIQLTECRHSINHDLRQDFIIIPLLGNCFIEVTAKRFDFPLADGQTGCGLMSTKAGQPVITLRKRFIKIDVCSTDTT